MTSRMTSLGHDIVKLENLGRKPCLPAIHLGSSAEEIETFQAKKMSMLCLKCGDYISLIRLQDHRTFHDALSLFQYDIQTKPTNGNQLSCQRIALVKNLSKISVNQSVYLKELGKIDLAYEILKSEMYGRLNKARPTLTDHAFDVKIRSLKTILNNGTSIGICQSSNEKWKSIMEDAYSYEADYICGGTNAAFFAIYDGYNGQTAAKKCASKLHDILKEKLANLDCSEDLCENGDCQFSDCFQEAYKDMDKVLLLGEEETSRNRWSGCSATTGILCGRNLHVANVGNVKAILMKADMTIQTLTEDHTPGNKKEKKRLKRIGDMKKLFKTNWVNGIAPTTRGLGNHGDPILKLNIINIPGFTCVPLDADDQVILLGSGGFWEVFDEDEVLVLVQDWLEMKESGSVERNDDSETEKQNSTRSLITVNVESTVHDIPIQLSNYNKEGKIETLLPNNQERTAEKEKNETCQNYNENECTGNDSIAGFKCGEDNLSEKSPNMVKISEVTDSLFPDLLKKMIVQDGHQIGLEMSKHLVSAALNGGGKSNVTVMVVLLNHVK